jgi:hypothetical protein
MPGEDFPNLGNRLGSILVPDMIEERNGAQAYIEGF